MYWLRDAILDYPQRAAAAAVAVLAIALGGFLFLSRGADRDEPAFSLKSCNTGFCLDQAKTPQKCSALSKQLCAFELSGTKPVGASVGQLRLNSPLIIQDVKISGDGQTWGASGHFMCATPAPGLPLVVKLTTPAKKTVDLARPGAPGVECSSLPAPPMR